MTMHSSDITLQVMTDNHFYDISLVAEASESRSWCFAGPIKACLILLESSLLVHVKS